MADSKGFMPWVQWIFAILGVIGFILALWKSYPDIKTKVEAAKSS